MCGRVCTVFVPLLACHAPHLHSPARLLPSALAVVCRARGSSGNSTAVCRHIRYIFCFLRVFFNLSRVLTLSLKLIKKSDANLVKCSVRRGCSKRVFSCTIPLVQPQCYSSQGKTQRARQVWWARASDTVCPNMYAAPYDDTSVLLLYFAELVLHARLFHFNFCRFSLVLFFFALAFLFTDFTSPHLHAEATTAARFYSICFTLDMRSAH